MGSVESCVSSSPRICPPPPLCPATRMECLYYPFFQVDSSRMHSWPCFPDPLPRPFPESSLQCRFLCGDMVFEKRVFPQAGSFSDVDGLQRVSDGVARRNAVLVPIDWICCSVLNWTEINAARITFRCIWYVRFISSVYVFRGGDGARNV